jgi:hypothetical protein
MVRTSVLNDALKTINNGEKGMFNTGSVGNNVANWLPAGKRQVLIRPSSKVITKFLQVMQKHGKLRWLLPILLVFFETIEFLGMLHIMSLGSLRTRTSCFTPPCSA